MVIVQTLSKFGHFFNKNVQATASKCRKLRKNTRQSAEKGTKINGNRANFS